MVESDLNDLILCLARNNAAMNDVMSALYICTPKLRSPRLGFSRNADAIAHKEGTRRSFTWPLVWSVGLGEKLPTILSGVLSQRNNLFSMVSGLKVVNCCKLMFFGWDEKLGPVCYRSRSHTKISLKSERVASWPLPFKFTPRTASNRNPRPELLSIETHAQNCFQQKPTKNLNLLSKPGL